MNNINETKLLISTLVVQLMLFFPIASQGMTIDEAVSLALTNNPDLQKQQMNLELSEQEVRDQESQQFGKVDIVANYNHFNNPRTLIPLTPNAIIHGDSTKIATTEDLFSTGVLYEVPLFTGFAQQRSIEIAGLEKEMAGVAIKLSREQLIYNVKSLYVNILSLQTQKKAQQEYYKALKYLYNDIALEVRLGKKARVDQLKAAADQEKARVKVQQFGGNIKIMEASLASLLNIDTFTPLDDSFLKVVSKKNSGDSKDLKNLERYRTAVLNVEKNAKLEEKSKSSDYPQIDFQAYYGQNFGVNDDSNVYDGDWENEEDWRIGVNFKWSIYDFGGRSAAKRKAVLRKQQSEQDKLTTELELRKLLKEANVQIQLAVDDFNSAETELALTRETERIERIRYTKGAADMDDLLYAKARNQLALSHTIMAKYNYQNRQFYLDYLLENGENK